MARLNDRSYFSTSRERLSTARSRKRSHVRRLMVEPLEERRLLATAELVKHITPTNIYSPGATEMTSVNGVAYFFAWDGVHGNELWKSDGTAAGTMLVKDILTYWPGSSGPIEITNVGESVFFRASVGYGHEALWKTDGTLAGTVQLKDGTTSGLTNVDGTLFFCNSSG